MTNRVLTINALEVNSVPIIYTCYGLGSCIGLFIVDRLNNLSAGAHIAMPSACSSDAYPDALQIMDHLVLRLQEQGSDLTCLRAKIAGGAKVYENALDIGAQNIKVVLQYLVKRRIFLAASDVGGRTARTVRFNSLTSAMEISTSDQRMYFI